MVGRKRHKQFELTIFRYSSHYVEKNKLGELGCQWLSKGKWPNLKKLIISK
jgi:hypothetical protein